MVGWHHQLNRHEFEQALWDGEGKGSLACCSLLGPNRWTPLSDQQQSNTGIKISEILESHLFKALPLIKFLWLICESMLHLMLSWTGLFKSFNNNMVTTFNKLLTLFYFSLWDLRTRCFFFLMKNNNFSLPGYSSTTLHASI